MTGDELRDFLAPNFAKFWLPDRFEFLDEIPKTSVGKFLKTELRQMYAPDKRSLVIKTIWLDNPPVNAVNGGIIDTLWSELEELDDDVRVVVLRGQGRPGVLGRRGHRRASRAAHRRRPPGRHPAGRRPDREARASPSSPRSTATASAAGSSSHSPATSGSRTPTRSSASPR